MTTSARPYSAPSTLAEFLARVDRLVTRHTGLSIDDLPDRAYCDYYEDGERPAAVAKRIIRSIQRGGYDDMEG